MSQFHTLRVILGDQLNASHKWLRKPDAGVMYLIAELHPEATYVTHHNQKLCAFFLAMEKFAQALTDAGHHVRYLTLDDTVDETLESLIIDTAHTLKVKKIELQRPDEYRVLMQYKSVAEQAKQSVSIHDTEHFMLPFEEIPKHFKPKMSNRMEHFYRKMRKRFNILMEDENTPVAGKWNFDSANRNKLKPKDMAHIPEPLLFNNDVSHIQERIKRHNIQYLGKADNAILWPVTRHDALHLLQFFCDHLLPNFGRYQDAMTDQTPQKWTLYHSRLSFALNTKMISPKHVIKAAILTYQYRKKEIDIAQVEGFVRQILGWREYVRGMYWINMPDYHTQNKLDAKRDLPSYFWSGDTKMNCLSQAIGQSLEFAYAHHIQRLMVTGNFCLLSEIEPSQVDEWYLGIYVDALEWVELPNTRSMSQFADGGWIASKPYAASGSYIQKMSDYCSSCHYDVKEKVGESSCPLNSLYWRFMNKHRERLLKNPRISVIYGNWDRQDAQQRDAILNRAQWCLDNIESL
ncbi:cryptochrome/photolyase family protein [Marinomonas piezotolerans]|uniref:Cryptochrome/photolyase family protein n=1 Tax=Marinomonas piezotolerans TaxID=2213058 RepID=A0A370UC72_9GAMM|nr:cryptochrome/photolyase family protein [Marinomonas piezotolerans]RDL45407.1 cryptochrome/photolyase family protein [Marinomonas piezotolerans]